MTRLLFLPLKLGAIALITILITIIFNYTPSSYGENPALPSLQTHPLPLTLSQWNPDNQEDYFEEIKTNSAGYFIWSDFPVKVYVESPPPDLSPSALSQFQQWQKASHSAIELWHNYIEMKEIEEEEKADILIYRQPPPMGGRLNPETGLYDLPRISAATTTVRFYIREENNQKTLRHRMIINVNPHQIYDYLESNIIHELGHSLGIWGHSLNQEDVMYYAHSKEIPDISYRDINTLKKIYQQPTRLGWQIP